MIDHVFLIESDDDVMGFSVDVFSEFQGYYTFAMQAEGDRNLLQFEHFYVRTTGQQRERDNGTTNK